MLAKLKEFIVVCIHCPKSLPEADVARLRQRIVSSKSHYWEETDPGIYLVYFSIRSGGRTKSIKLTAALGTLKKPGSALSEIGVAKAIGELVTEANWYGKILTAPFGDAVNQAMRKAREDFERSSPTTGRDENS